MAAGRMMLCREPYMPFWYLPDDPVYTSESSLEPPCRECHEEAGVEP
jgi:hypothetical protein